MTCQSCGCIIIENASPALCECGVIHIDFGDEPGDESADPGDMDGDHASALGSVYGPEDYDYPEYDDPLAYCDEY